LSSADHARDGFKTSTTTTIAMTATTTTIAMTATTTTIAIKTTTTTTSSTTTNSTYIERPQSMQEMKVGQSPQPPDPRKKKDSLCTDSRMTMRQTDKTRLMNFIFQFLLL
jgi:hypothetical protein